MNLEFIKDYLISKGFEASVVGENDSPNLVVKFLVDGKDLELICFPEKEISRLPIFYLHKPPDLGVLAHVNFLAGFGFICLNDRDSVSVNFEQPHLAYEDSLRKHIALLEKTIGDPDWNYSELLREFKPNWNRLCTENKPLICSSSNADAEIIDILKPVSKATVGFDSYYLAVPNNTKDLNSYTYIRESVGDNKRSRSSEKGLILSLSSVTPAPISPVELGSWYIENIKNIEAGHLDFFRNTATKWVDHEIWIVFNAKVSSGITWFCIKLSAKDKKARKRPIPLSVEDLTHWNLSAHSVSLFNKELIMPRGGAYPSLAAKKVLLVGCGSVGSEIAHKVASSGVGELHLSDPEVFETENLYRHTLSRSWIGYKKSLGLSLDLGVKYPWLKSKHFSGALLDFRNRALLEQYDLVIIAIGAPTHERLFHDFILNEEVDTPVVNTWVEGYGLGGHATLDIPDKKGCLRCAYVDTDSLGRGLSSNLNFLEDNQDLTINHAGCGDLFLPYNAMYSAQTALIASELAVKYLLGKITESSKVSWKGDASDAVSNGFKLTHRYDVFSKSLQVTPLHNLDCDICHD